jgi:hypothetical protein
MDALSDIARAILYEGYILWPYRRSALKNQQRWTFGGVYPPSFAAESSGVDRAAVIAQCLVEASGDARLEVSVRFLQVVARQILRGTSDKLEPVDLLTVAGERLLSWDEAIEREVAVSLPLTVDTTSVAVPIEIDAGSAREERRERDGTVAGAIERRWERLVGTITADAEGIDANGLHRITVRVTNASSWPALDRDSAVRRTFVSAHIALRAHPGSFVSLLDPPAPFAAAAAACRGDGLWPVLVGDEGSRDAMLASPIILYDYPRVAPESPGDLFDGGEIDQLLILNILTMSEEEQREMRDSDPRAREILERCASLSTSELSALHGTIRSVRMFEPGEVTR